MADRLGIIGLGRMGLPIAQRLAGAGYSVSVWDTNDDRMALAAGFGAIRADSAMNLAAGVDLLLTVLPGAAEAREVLIDGGMLDSLRAGCCWLDLTSNDPRVSALAAEGAAARGVDSVAAPMGGGPVAATDGTLTFFVAGAPSGVARVQPVLLRLGTPGPSMGAAVASAHTAKLIANSLWFSQVVAVTEAFLVAQSLGLGADELTAAIEASAGKSEFTTRSLDALLDGEYLETFGIDRVVEELDILRDLAVDAATPYALGTLVAALHREALATYGPIPGELLAARLLEDRAGTTVRRRRFRAATAADLDLLLSARQVDPVAIVDAERYRVELEQRQYRLEWSWLHEVDGKLLARALWWAPPGAENPVSLDCLWVDESVEDPARLAAELLAAGHAALAADRLPGLTLTVDVGWRADAAAVRAVAWRTDAAASAGLTESIERLSYAWEEGMPLPERSTRLRFTPADDDAFLRVFAAVAQGSLDLLTLHNLDTMGVDGQAADDLEFYLSLPGDRGAWRLAHAMDGSLVGFIIPSRSAYDASVSYLGVVPEHRGKGFVDDLLAEITLVHAASGAPRITGTTDTTNAPMAAAFLRAGYRVTTARVVLGAPE